MSDIDFSEHIYIEKIKQYEINDKFLNLCHSNNLEEIKTLINFVEKETLNEALLNSSKKNSLQIIQYLVKNGADLYTGNNEILSFSCMLGYVDVIDFFIKQSKIDNVKIDLDNSIYLACCHHQLDTVKYFTSNTIITSNDQFLDAIKAALRQNRIDILQHFINDCNQNMYIVITNIIDSTEPNIVQWATQYQKAVELKEKLEDDLLTNEDSDKIKIKKIKV